MMILQLLLFVLLGYVLKLATINLTPRILDKLETIFRWAFGVSMFLGACTICVTTFTSEAVDGVALSILQTIRFIACVVIEFTTSWFLMGFLRNIYLNRVKENPEWLRQKKNIEEMHEKLDELNIVNKSLAGLIDNKALDSVLDVMLNQAKRDVKCYIHEHKEHLARIASMEQQLQNLKSTRG